MSADGGHLGWRSGSLDIILKVDHLSWYMYININNNNKIYHRKRETIDTSDTCNHDRSLYWSGTCTLIIIIIIKYIIETEK
jgi:hypothetical protein